MIESSQMIWVNPYSWKPIIPTMEVKTIKFLRQLQREQLFALCKHGSESRKTRMESQFPIKFSGAADTNTNEQCTSFRQTFGG
jgi:hypothetical protein